MHKKIIITAGIALAVGFGAGYGMHSTPARAQDSQNGYAGGSGKIMRGNGNGGGFLSGTVVNKDAGSVTLNTRDGSSHVVFITPDTTISKSVNGTMSDVSVGTTIIVSGTTNSDGSVSANLIQLRPALSPAATPAQ